METYLVWPSSVVLDGAFSRRDLPGDGSSPSGLELSDSDAIRVELPKVASGMGIAVS